MDTCAQMEGPLGPLELVLQAVVNCLVQVLGTEL